MSLFRLSSGMHLLLKRLQDCLLAALVLLDGSTIPQLSQFLLVVETIDRSNSGNKPYKLVDSTTQIKRVFSVLLFQEECASVTLVVYGRNLHKRFFLKLHKQLFDLIANPNQMFFFWLCRCQLYEPLTWFLLVNLLSMFYYFYPIVDCGIFRSRLVSLVLRLKLSPYRVWLYGLNIF